MITKVTVENKIITLDSDQGIFDKDLADRIERLTLETSHIVATLVRRKDFGERIFVINELGGIDRQPKEHAIFDISQATVQNSLIMKVVIEGVRIGIEIKHGIFWRDFEYKIWSIIIGKDRLFVLLDVMGTRNNPQKNRNLYCLNEKAEILWQIQDPDTYRPGLPKSDSPFTGMGISQEGKLTVYNWDSHRYEVDIETGRLSNAHWVK